jgi:hypothetical protein
VTTTQAADGRRIVGLFVPFDHAGQRVSEIAFQPSTLGHLMRWQDGLIAGALPLMMELTGMERLAIEAIRHPDDERVMAAFLDHVQPAIAADIRDGVRRVPSAGEVDSFTPGPSPGYDIEQQPDEPPSDYVPGLDD